MSHNSETTGKEVMVWGQNRYDEAPSRAASDVGNYLWLFRGGYGSFRVAYCVGWRYGEQSVGEGGGRFWLGSRYSGSIKRALNQSPKDTGWQVCQGTDKCLVRGIGFFRSAVLGVFESLLLPKIWVTLEKEHPCFLWFVSAGASNTWHIYMKRKSIFSRVTYRYRDTCTTYAFINIHSCM